MSDLPNDPVKTLREALAASVARIPLFETAVATAQERLRRELTKVEKLRELVALYEADEAPATAEQLTLPGATNVVIGHGAGGHSTGSTGTVKTGAEAASGTKTARMVSSITELLRLRGAVHRKVLLDRLMSDGIMGHERDPMAHLAAFLSSHKDQFASDGRGIFSLRQSSVITDPPSPPNMAKVPNDDLAMEAAQ